MSDVNSYALKTSYGELILADFEGRICLCDWRYRKMRRLVDRRIENFLGCSFHYCGHVPEDETVASNGIPELIIRLCGQLREYFADLRHVFSLPVQLTGSDFQNEVWSELLKVPYGETISYTELARGMRRTDSVRAVASAVGANALSFIVPCHRVIRLSGDLAGYAGGVGVKKRILTLESREVSVDL